MAPPPEFRERRKNHALRALYLRVDTLEKINKDQETAIKLLEEKAVTKNWLMGGLLIVAMGVASGGYGFAKGLEENARKPIAAQGEKLDRFIDAQMATNAAQMSTNVKTEAMYLNSIERRPREEVREAVLRSTTKEK